MGTRFESVIDFAIDQEIKAAELYENFRKVIKSKTTKKLLDEMARMERVHEKKLREFKETGTAYISKIGEVSDLHISDYLVEKKITDSSPVEDIFIFAMKAEEKAYKLYKKLASLETEENVKRIFISLAAEEKNHKYDLETEYEKNYIKED